MERVIPQANVSRSTRVHLFALFPARSLRSCKHFSPEPSALSRSLFWVPRAYIEFRLLYEKFDSADCPQKIRHSSWNSTFLLCAVAALRALERFVFGPWRNARHAARI